MRSVPTKTVENQRDATSWSFAVEFEKFLYKKDMRSGMVKMGTVLTSRSPEGGWVSSFWHESGVSRGSRC